MNNSNFDGKLELEVSNFGPIFEANIDLRPLSVFIGPSNTGKSYLAILIYALHRHFSGRRSFGGYSFRLPSRYWPKISELSDESLEALIQGAETHSWSPDAQGEDISLTSEIARPLSQLYESSVDDITQEVHRCFGLNSNDRLIRRGRNNSARIVVRRAFLRDSADVEHCLTLSKQSSLKTTIPVGTRLQTSQEDSLSIQRLFSRYEAIFDKDNKILTRRLSIALEYLRLLGDWSLPSATGALHLPAYYLPADRTGVMHSHNVVVSALIANASNAGLQPMVSTPMLTGVLADFLRELIAMPAPRHSPTPLENFGTMIENDVLKGRVRVDRSSLDYPIFAYQPKGWKDDLPLANASSMVSELAPIVLYLRHIVEPNNVLIVEEPESHLHPAMQVEFTRQLAILVNAGIRVIVTTHSEWLLEELANIVRRSELNANNRAVEQRDHVALRPEEVGAWLFEPKQRPKGSTVSEIRIDEAGLYPTDFDAVSTALHNEWAEITSRIEASP